DAEPRADVRDAPHAERVTDPVARDMITDLRVRRGRRDHPEHRGDRDQDATSGSVHDASSSGSDPDALAFDPSELDDSTGVASDGVRHARDVEDHRRLPRAPELEEDLEVLVGEAEIRTALREHVREREDRELPGEGAGRAEELKAVRRHD